MPLLPWHHRVRRDKISPQRSSFLNRQEVRHVAQNGTLIIKDQFIDLLASVPLHLERLRWSAGIPCNRLRSLGIALPQIPRFALLRFAFAGCTGHIAGNELQQSSLPKLQGGFSILHLRSSHRVHTGTNAANFPRRADGAQHPPFPPPSVSCRARLRYIFSSWYGFPPSGLAVSGRRVCLHAFADREVNPSS